MAFDGLRGNREHDGIIEMDAENMIANSFFASGRS